jgi:hypothetical protein
MVKNLVAYAELDQSKREAEESQRSAYQRIACEYSRHKQHKDL